MAGSTCQGLEICDQPGHTASDPSPGGNPCPWQQEVLRQGMRQGRSGFFGGLGTWGEELGRIGLWVQNYLSFGGNRAWGS